jgi:hypothetical protein
MRPGRLAACALAGSLLALPRTAGADDLATLSVGGGLALVARQWTGHAGFTSWAGWTDSVESARLEADHRAGGGSTFAATLGLRVSRSFGVSLSVSRSQRDASAEVSLTLPHPFLSAHPRSAAGQASGLGYREVAVHLDLDYRPLVRRRLELALFAGPTLLKLETDAIDSAQARDEYPYEQPSYLSAHSFGVEAEATAGWNAGASASWLASRHFDLGLVARYTAVRPQLRPAGVEALTLDAGGLALTAELRLRY